jgi:hypothetical protein
MTGPRRGYFWGGAGLLVLVMVAAIVVANVVAQKHDPQGSAARSARTQVDWAMVAALDDVARQLSLGAPIGSGVEDTCRATRPASLDDSITCDRVRYGVYALLASVDAHSLAGRLSPTWRVDGSFCDADLKLDTACLTDTALALELAVEPGSKYAHQPIIFSRPKVPGTHVEFPEYYKIKVTGPSIVVMVSSTDYVG